MTLPTKTAVSELKMGDTTPPATLVNDRYRLVSGWRQVKRYFSEPVEFAIDEADGDRPVVLRKFEFEYRTARTDLGKRCMEMRPHPYLVRPYDEFASDESICLVMERIIPDDSIADARLIQRSGSRISVNQGMARLHFQQLISAVRHCHRHGLCFVEPRESTVLLGPGTSGVKLCVSHRTLFNCADHMEGGYIGTFPMYMAPEVIAEDAGKDERSDMWSCGILLYTMAFGRSPVEADNMIKVLLKILKDDIEIPAGDWDPGLVDLVLGLLCRDPTARMTMDDVLQHPWFVEGFDPAILSEAFAHSR